MKNAGRWLGISLVLIVLASTTVAYPRVAERTAPATDSRSAARQALSEARRLGSARWAPAELEKAEARLESALDLERAQARRFFLLRDLRDSRAAYREAERLARETLSSSRLSSEAAAEHARQAIEEAESSLQEATDHLSLLGRTPDLDHLLARSKARLREGRAQFALHNYDLAAELARETLAGTSSLTREVGRELSRYLDRAEVARWRQWTADTVAQSRQTGGTAIVVSKDDHTLTLYKAGRKVAEFTIELGAGGPAPKLQSGDAATPEGRYRVSKMKSGAATRYYRALLIDYPNADDLRRFQERKRRNEIARNAAVGSLIEIHGHGGRDWNWTDGCVAMTDSDIDRLYPLVGTGTPVTIVGSTSGDGVYSRAARRIQEASRHDDSID